MTFTDPIWELCTINDGTRSKTYNFVRIVLNNFRQVMIEAEKALKFVSNNIMIVLPGQSLVLPIYIDGEFMLYDELPDTKVWAIRTEYVDSRTGSVFWAQNNPLFKHSLEEIWRENVQPLDTPIEGSEFWYFQDDDGTIKQGIDFYGEGQNRYFYLLADGGPVIRDISIIWLLIYILDKLGLFNLAQRFVTMVLTNMSNMIMKARVRSLYKELKQTNFNITNHVMVEGDETLTTVKALKDMIGVRLLLR